MESQNEPKLEDYGLDASSYENYRKQKIELEKELYQYKNDLDNSLVEFKKDIKSSFPNILSDYIVSGSVIAGWVSLIIEWNYFWIFAILFIFGLFLYNSEDKLIKPKEIELKEKKDLKNKEINEKIEILKNKIYPFEKASGNFYKKYLENFFNNNLYKKRSGSEKFELALSEFSDMINEVDEINKKLQIIKIPTPYKSYLEGRQINHQLQKNKKVFHSFDNIKPQKELEEKIEEIKPEIAVIPKIEIPKKIIHEHDYLNQIMKDRKNLNNKNEEILEINDKESNIINSSADEVKQHIEVEENKNKKGFWDNLMNDVRSEIEEANNNTSTKEIVSTIDIISPEKKYSLPRKIDWESINKNKPITGMKGEEIVLDMEKSYLKSIEREDLAVKVRHLSKEEGDGAGYDILSYFPDGQEKYIEVKSSKNTNSNSFNISSNELDFMKNNQYNYQIYRIFNVNENNEVPTLKIDKASDILTFKKITPVQYVVKME